ncbi:MAG: hypothetical protein NT045_04220 [Candidatus Aureabacteria bacterium]|nr:hypothetical protein [Candidatus Auribacterota bacterium]
MPRIVFYISGHGLGHAMRMKEVLLEIHALDPSAELHVIGNMPGWVYQEPPAARIRRRELVCDVGAIQRDSLHLDVRGTLEANASFYRDIGAMVRREAEFLRRERIGLVVGDIPPLAFLSAAAAGVRSVAVGNFSWDWIYEEYVMEDRRFEWVLDLIREAYGKADLLLRLPMHGDMGVFPAIRDIPLIARHARIPREEVRERLGIGRAERRRVILISMGGHNAADIEHTPATDFGEYLFISFFRPAAGIPHLILLEDKAGMSHPDIVRASEAVISKPGYCTVAECIANATPLVYTTRDHFREFPVMEEGVRRYCRSCLMPREDFHAGAWRRHLDAFFSAPGNVPGPSIPTDGARHAARVILSMAR